MTYQGLPICQHIDFGAFLQDVRAGLMAASAGIHANYGKSSDASRRVNAAIHQVDELRTAIDNLAGNERPDLGGWVNQIYYGTFPEEREPIVSAILEQHKADNPRCC